MFNVYGIFVFLYDGMVTRLKSPTQMKDLISTNSSVWILKRAGLRNDMMIKIKFLSVCCVRGEEGDSNTDVILILQHIPSLLITDS